MSAYYASSGSCRNRVVDVLVVEGCCAATRWELLKEIRATETVLRNMAAARFEAATGLNPHTALPSRLDDSSIPGDDSIALDRSTAWFEATCGVSLDRGCSRGLKRQQVKLSMTLRYLNYSEVFQQGLQGSRLEGLLTAVLREAVSDVLALPLGDVVAIRFWRGSVLVEIVIDPGVTTPEVMKVGPMCASSKNCRLLNGSLDKTEVSLERPLFDRKTVYGSFLPPG